MKLRKLRLFSLALLFSVFGFVGCEGPEGPVGPVGATGAAGVDGAIGADGTTQCAACHNKTVSNLVTAQWSESAHGIGANVGYAGGRASCAKCHSHEGFLETNMTGEKATAADITDPHAIGCSTCHDFHETLDFATDGKDYALRNTKPVKLIMDDGATTLDFGNTSNACIQCHQPRGGAPVGTDGMFEITSTRFSSHHGPQGVVLQGIGAYEFGTKIVVANPHVNTSSCVECHMHKPSTLPAEHKWDASPESCVKCHDGGVSDTEIDSKKAEIATLMASLRTNLITAGLLTEADSPIKGTFTIDQAGALYNYGMFLEDRSLGVHNFPYYKAVLMASNAVFTK